MPHTANNTCAGGHLARPDRNKACAVALEILPTRRPQHWCLARSTLPFGVRGRPGGQTTAARRVCARFKLQRVIFTVPHAIASATSALGMSRAQSAHVLPRGGRREATLQRRRTYSSGPLSAVCRQLDTHFSGCTNTGCTAPAQTLPLARPSWPFRLPALSAVTLHVAISLASIAAVRAAL